MAIGTRAVLAIPHHVISSLELKVSHKNGFSISCELTFSKYLEYLTSVTRQSTSHLVDIITHRLDFLNYGHSQWETLGEPFQFLSFYKDYFC